MASFTSRPLYPCGNSTLHPLNARQSDHRAPVGVLEKSKIAFLYRESNPVAWSLYQLDSHGRFGSNTYYDIVQVCRPHVLVPVHVTAFSLWCARSAMRISETYETGEFYKHVRFRIPQEALAILLWSVKGRWSVQSSACLSFWNSLLLVSGTAWLMVNILMVSRNSCRTIPQLHKECHATVDTVGITCL